LAHLSKGGKTSLTLLYESCPRARSPVQLHARAQYILLGCLLSINTGGFSIFGAVPAWGENTASPPSGSKYQAHDPNEVKAARLSKEPEFPYVPPYTGKGVKFLSGLSHPKMRNGRQCIQGRYLAKEDSKTVLAWYRSALQGEGWTLEQGQPVASAVAARKLKDGLIVFVHARDNPGSGYRCEYLIRYLIVPPPPAPNKTGT
jgi:hypothetical protein